jgi:hypothetical protein
MYRQHGSAAALFAMLTFGALSYAIFLGVYLRGYIIVVAALPFALWLTVRYFSAERLRVWLGVALGVFMAAMFYTYLTSAVSFGALGLYTLLVYPRRVWRWALPALVALPLAVPLVLSKLETVVERVDVLEGRALPPFFAAMWSFYSHYGGVVAPLWALLFALATAAAAWRWWAQRKARGTVVGQTGGLSPLLKRVSSNPLISPLRRRSALALLVWMSVGPALMYFLDNVLDFFSPRYSWWVLIGVALWMGVALAALPRAGRVLAGVLLAGIMFAPVPFDYYSLQAYRPFSANFAWLRERLQPGDAILLDTNCGGGLAPRLGDDGETLELGRRFTCGTPEQWHYFIDVYFPDGGLHFITEPGDERRIWYVKQAGWHDLSLEERVRAGRVEREFVGPWDFLIMLYEAPPDPEGIPFANGMRFHGADFLEDDGRVWTGPLVRHDDKPMRVRLWWSVDEPVTFDYSISVQMQRDGGVIAQADGAPNVTGEPREITRWETGRYYIDERELFIPWPTRPRAYAMMLAVYDWGTGERVPAPGVNADTFLPLRTLYIQSH